ncbi:hypothetical protein HP467_01460 [Curtobacterium albidum]|uniref:Fungal lipase-like domain-containing protein n=1 Tax=Curtobacterium citreum TaxID=2036 RepID=A0A850DQI5_9MICO|nr:hypothetical protein [Curtobacterium albidum]NUU26785.1 hypothetical protein [Curtobacterium albidum]
MSDGIKVDYAEIDRLTTGITALNTFAGPLVPKVGALSVDGDLLASASLSPGTALAAEGAVINASAQLSVTLVSTEALVIITASISKMYETADRSLRVAVLTTEFALSLGKEAFRRFNVILETLPSDLKKLSIVLGSVERGATLMALVEGVVSVARGDNPTGVWRATVDGFWDGVGSGLEAGLGALGGEYDAILGRLIADGHLLGLFDDGSVIMGRPDSLTQAELDERSNTARANSKDATGINVQTDEQGHIIPTDVSSMFEGSKQIDGIGQKDLADVRVLTKHHADGTWSFVVQVPSTMNWSPAAGSPPNDLTSDLYALHSGNSALSEAAFAALRQAMDTAGAPMDSPVMVSGFSLGGITAATMAADSQGFNIQQVVTAGSPVANIPIPPQTRVLSFEAHGDPIPSLDGAANPDRTGWDTVRAAPSALEGERDSKMVHSGARHDADRYALMAQQQPHDETNIKRFLSSEHPNAKEQVTVEDYYATRR